MYVELNLSELREVDVALAQRLHELRVELVHTDRRELRAELRERVERLERVQWRMHGLLTEVELPV